MTPFERVEYTWAKMTTPNLSRAEQLEVLRDAFDVHALALLDKDDGTVADIIQGPGIAARQVSRGVAEAAAAHVLAALCVKALGQWD